MRLSVLLVVVAADPARRELGKRKQGAKALAAMTEASLAAAARDDAIRQERELKYHRSTRRAAVVISRALRSKLARLHAAA